MNSLLTAKSLRRRARLSLTVETLEDRRTPAALFFDDFSNPANAGQWSLGTNWQIGTAAASSGHNNGNPDPAADFSPSADNRLAGVVIGGNLPPTVGTSGYLTSPIISTAGQPSAVLNLARWLNSDYPTYMSSTLEVFDGTAWQTLFAVAPGVGVADASWQKVGYDLSAYRNSQMRVRIGYAVTSTGAYTVSSWNVDDIRVGRKPTPADDLKATAPGQPLVLPVADLTANDTHPDGLTTTLSALDGLSSQGGTVSLAPDATVTYTPAAGFIGLDTFQYTVVDPFGWSSQATVHVRVGRPPVAADDTFAVAPNGSTTFTIADLLVNDSDPDGNTFNVAGINAVTAQGVVISNPSAGVYSYAAPVGFHGDDTLQYQIADSTGLASTGTVHFLVDNAPLTSPLTLNGVQGVPLGFADSTILGNATDPDGDPLSLSAVDAQSAAGGTVSRTGNQLTYSPPAGFHGTDSFNYTVADSFGLTATDVVNIQVNGTPKVLNEGFGLLENYHLTVGAGQLLANDSDPENDSLAIALASGVTAGTLNFSADGSFDYQPDPGFIGTASFGYTVSDGHSLGYGQVNIYVTQTLSRSSAPQLQMADDTGVSPTDGVTDVRFPGFFGTAEPNTLLTLRLDGNSVGKTVVDGAGDWSVVPIVPLPVGRHLLTVVVTDFSGNEGPESAPSQIVIVGEPVGRVATAAIAGATAAASKLPQKVAVYDGIGQLLFQVAPGWKIADGVRIATGDVNGDGIADIAVTPSAGPLLGSVRIYDGVTGNLLMNQVPMAANVKTGIAVGDVNNDGFADLIAVGLNGKSVGHVVGISGKTQLPLFDWTKVAGVTVSGVTVGDVNGDLIDDVLLQQNQKPFGVDVVAWNVADRSLIRRYDGAAFGLTATSRVAVGRITGNQMGSDNIADLIISNVGKVTQIIIVNGQDGTIASKFTTPGTGTGSRAVAAADLDGDGAVEILVGSGKGVKSDGLVHAVTLNGSAFTTPSYDPFGPGFHGTLEV